MNINGTNINNKVSCKNKNYIIQELNKKWARFFVEVHDFVHDNIIMLDNHAECFFNPLIFLERNLCSIEEGRGFIIDVNYREHGNPHIIVKDTAYRQIAELFITEEIPQSSSDLRVNKVSTKPVNTKKLSQLADKIVDWAKDTCKEDSSKNNWQWAKDEWLLGEKSSGRIFKRADKDSIFKPISKYRV